MIRLASLLLPALFSAVAAAAADGTPQIVGAPDAPVRLASAKLLNAGAEPLVLLYAATNAATSAVEQFTVTVLVFDAGGRLKARQVAPGRRDLAVGETKYSAMVLDVGGIAPTDTLLAGVDQVQRAGSEEWWRADIRALAEAAVSAGRAPAAPPRE